MAPLALPAVPARSEDSVGGPIGEITELLEVAEVPIEAASS
jgi:hypothetical protein